MLNYYDEIKEAILEVLEEDAEVRNILYSENDEDTIIEKLVDYLFNCDYVTGNASGTYYFSSYESRKHCYNYFRDVFEALEEFCYNSELTKFKTFVNLVEEGYLNIENMTLDYELLNEIGEDEKYAILYDFEEIENLNFETLDVITRCYMASEVVSSVVKNFLKYQK